jgi:hypothetical protein
MTVSQEPAADAGDNQARLSGDALVQLDADLHCLAFSDAIGVSGSAAQSALERLAEAGGVIRVLADDLDENVLQAALGQHQLSEGPTGSRLRELAQSDGSLLAMFQRRAGQFDAVIARRRDTGAGTGEINDPPLESDDACVIAAATVLVSSAGGPLMLAAALYGASQVC